MKILAALVIAAMRPWSPLVAAESRAVRLDAATLGAIVWVESHGHPGTVKYEHDGSCSVGLAGINVPGCDPQRVAAVMPPGANVREAAKLLVAKAKWCRDHRTDVVCMRGGAVAAYNPGDRGYAARVQAVAKVLRASAWMTYRRPK